MFLWILITFFVIILFWNFIPIMYPNTNKEGIDNYNEYDTNDPNNTMILVQQNSGNIKFLKERVDDLAGINDKVTDIQSQVDLMSSQMDDLVQQQADFAQDMAGDTPVDVTGTDLTDEEND